MNTPQLKTFQIENMTCASCVGRVEKALLAVPNIAKASANLANETVQVSTDKPVTDLVVIQALADAGYPAVSEDVTLNVENMTCASCVGRVEKALKAGAGVLDASVNLAAETAQVRFVAGVTSPAEIAEIATQAGYPAKAKSYDQPSHTDRKAQEIATLGRLTLLAAILALPVFAIEMGGHIFPALHAFINNTIGMQNSRLLQFVLTTAVLFGPGFRFYTKGYPALLKGVPDMNSLVALGTSAAYGFSLVATFIPNLLPDGTANVYYEAAAVIVVLILLGRFLEARAKGRTGQAIRKLVGLQPKIANVERDGKIVEMAIENIVKGECLTNLHHIPSCKTPFDGHPMA